MTPGGVVSEMPELGPNVAGLREYLCGAGVGELYVQFASLGGEVSVANRAGGGTSVAATLPLN